MRIFFKKWTICGGHINRSQTALNILQFMDLTLKPGKYVYVSIRLENLYKETQKCYIK